MSGEVVVVLEQGGDRGAVIGVGVAQYELGMGCAVVVAQPTSVVPERVFNYSEFSPSVGTVDSNASQTLHERFSTIPNLALRLGVSNLVRSTVRIAVFSTIPNLALRLGMDISALQRIALGLVFNYSEFSPSVGHPELTSQQVNAAWIYGFQLFRI